MTSPIALPPVVDAGATAELLESRPDVRIIDVRTPAEFESVHIPGSYNVPLDLLGEHRQELQAAISTPVILVCRTGSRAQQADRVLRETGLDQLHVLDGGIMAWEVAGKPVNRSERQKWGLERQVRGVAGGLVLAGALGGLLLWPPLTVLSAAIGGGLLFSALTNTCGMAMLLAKLPYNRTAECDIREIVGRISVGQPGQGMS